MMGNDKDAGILISPPCHDNELDAVENERIVDDYSR